MQSIIPLIDAFNSFVHIPVDATERVVDDEEHLIVACADEIEVFKETAVSGGGEKRRWNGTKRWENPRAGGVKLFADMGEDETSLEAISMDQEDMKQKVIENLCWERVVFIGLSKEHALN